MWTRLLRSLRHLPASGILLEFRSFGNVFSLMRRPRRCPQSRVYVHGLLAERNEHCILCKCRGKYRYRMGGFQREMSPVEEWTFMAWLKGEIFLPQPPKFVTETHVGAERDAFISYFRKRLCPRLYAHLPVGLTLPVAGAKLHLCRSLLPASTLDGDTARIKTLFSSSQRVDCSSRSEVVEFVFIHPEARLEWVDAAFRIGRGSLLL